MSSHDEVAIPERIGYFWWRTENWYKELSAGMKKEGKQEGEDEWETKE
jgi:hypothetical protein